jgi:hypothetical protein
VPLGDERIALVGAFLDVLVVQAASQLQEVRGRRSVVFDAGRGDRCSGDGSGDLFDDRRVDDGLRDDGSVDDSGRKRAAGGELSAKLFVLLRQTTQLYNDLVQEVIDLVLVVALAELGLREALVNNVFRS